MRTGELAGRPLGSGGRSCRNGAHDAIERRRCKWRVLRRARRPPIPAAKVLGVEPSPTQRSPVRRCGALALRDIVGTPLAVCWVQST